MVLTRLKQTNKLNEKVTYGSNMKHHIYIPYVGLNILFLPFFFLKSYVDSNNTEAIAAYNLKLKPKINTCIHVHTTHHKNWVMDSMRVTTN